MDPETKKYLDDQHKLIFTEIGDLKTQNTDLRTELAPVIRIYNSFNGAGTVATWFFKIVVIPLSVVVGICYEIKRTVHGG